MAVLSSALMLAASGEDYWSSEFFGLDANQRFVVILTAIGCVTAVILTLAGIAFSWIDGANRRRMEAEMKRDMLDRGMSAEDITKIIETAAPPEDATERWIASWCKKK